jgi:hypothetical protein
MTTPLRAIGIFVLIAGAAVAAAPFSHAVHLRMKLACITCHSAATASARPDDNLLPDRPVCLECHKQVEILAPIRTRVAKFSHAGHLRLGDVAKLIAAAIDAKTYLSPPGDIRRHLDSPNPCEACHRWLGASNRASAENLPRMADCLVCHSRIDPPRSCEKCHEKGANLKPVNHTAGFLKSHASAKSELAKTTCAVCHGRKFTCSPCH